MPLALNDRARKIAEALLRDAEALRIAARQCSSGATLVDCGIELPGGLEAGRQLAEVCLAGLGRVALQPSLSTSGTGVAVHVITDQPVAACMASQYAGWKIDGHGYFAMGSGPMRAAAGTEEVFQRLGFRETVEAAVGVLETRKLPPSVVCGEIAAKCGISADRLTLLLAPTASLAGNVQIVARSVETALHKLFELEFDLHQIISAAGVAPLPPVAKHDLAGIGRTNDAILYGSEVTLFVRCDDAMIEAVGPRVPSSASHDYGRPFAEIFAAYDHDFYKIDPHLFSPAVITFNNLNSGRTFRFGQLNPAILKKSFK